MLRWEPSRVMAMLRSLMARQRLCLDSEACRASFALR
jgi:hypothetical protein